MRVWSCIICTYLLGSSEGLINHGPAFDLAFNAMCNSKEQVLAVDTLHKYARNRSRNTCGSGYIYVVDRLCGFLAWIHEKS